MVLSLLKHFDIQRIAMGSTNSSDHLRYKGLHTFIRVWGEEWTPVLLPPPPNDDNLIMYTYLHASDVDIMYFLCKNTDWY